MTEPILTPFLGAADVTVYQGDCIEVMRQMPESSVDAIVTDPPYGLEFMGRDWDGFGTPLGFQTWTEAWAREALRVLKPGGHLLAFAGTRTYHRMASGVEDAGFEIRDCIAWMYGSGFPKSLDVSKAIDKQRDDRDDILRVTAEIARLRDVAGLTNRDLDQMFGFAGMAGHWTSTKSQPAVPRIDQWAELRTILKPDQWLDDEVWRLNGRKGTSGEAWDQREVIGEREVPVGHAFAGSTYGGNSSNRTINLTTAATPDARKWSGWGTALKPAFEPIVVARKPLIGTVAQNVLEHGTGAINVDGCRIGTRADSPQVTGAKRTSLTYNAIDVPGGKILDGGRWPANVTLDETAAAMLDEQAPNTGGGGFCGGGIGTGLVYGEPGSGQTRVTGRIDANGGASRFFYTAKASKKDRNTNGANNTHPTVKPTTLMRWLIRLVTPPGGIILDPFGGSGSTGVAARAEGVRCILIEREAEYLDIIRQRLDEGPLFSNLD